MGLLVCIGIVHYTALLKDESRPVFYTPLLKDESRPVFYTPLLNEEGTGYKNTRSDFYNQGWLSPRCSWVVE
jgi:hypothetical protein